MEIAIYWQCKIYGKLIINLANALTERIYKIKCKYGDHGKKCKTCETKYKDCECYLEYTNFKDNLIIKYKCFRCNKSYQKKFGVNLTLIWVGFLGVTVAIGGK